MSEFPRKAFLLLDPEKGWEESNPPIPVMVHGVYQSNDGEGQHFPVVAIELPDGRLWSIYVGAGNILRFEESHRRLKQDEISRREVPE